jgi:cystathionine beta-lyase/cystathionine gamma-synthase
LDFETLLIHAGEPEQPHQGAVVPPIYQSSTYLYQGTVDDYGAVRYIRLSNTPTHSILHAKIAALEGGEAALSLASGMGAISSTLLAVLGTGGHVLHQDCLYGGTHSFVTEDLPALGHASTALPRESGPEEWKKLLRPTTRAIYVEAITNPLMEVMDLAPVIAFAREHGLVSIIDATFASPVNFQALPFGFDLSIHSATKYLNGHTDIVAGCVAGKAELVERIRKISLHFGASLDPHACFLLHRGLKTLALRVRAQNESALAIARWLESSSLCTAVNYPGLESHPSHANASRYLRGFGGMLSFEVAGEAREAQAFIDALEIPYDAPSLGGVETLVTRPATTSHAGLSRAERERLGIRDGLIRLSVGIESTTDLIADLEQAGKKAGQRGRS